ncbi:MAG TPA: hypothetical protein VG273_02005 [Bryobacteraceae bacterium]|jgi:hypothetical protein|nr:hypothetical protein [Bryobacteraceae bacterium]
MAKAKADAQKEDGGILKTVAKAVGTAAGAVAHVAGVAAPHTSPPAQSAAKAGRLLPKHKSRLPRKAKKALKANAEKKAVARQ